MPTTPRKKLIEVALPLEAINVASAREKSIRHGHPSTLHLWWARRPLAAARAVIFSSLVDDPDSPDALPAFVEACRNLPKGPNATANDTPRMRLFDFIEVLVQWESTTDEKVLKTARDLIMIATEGNPPPLLDPFAGGGSIPLEAQRLGLEAHASDLNPVAVMINKAQIEIPPRFANQPPVNPRDRQQMNSGTGWKGAAGLAADVRYYGEWMREKAWERIGHLYPKHNGETVIAWIWARTAKCPNPACGAQIPLISTFELSKKPERRVWIEPVIDYDNKRVNFDVKSGLGNAPEATKVGRGARFRCLVCKEIAPEEHIREESMSRRMGQQLVSIVTEGSNRRNYYAPTIEQISVAESEQPKWQPIQEMPRDTSDLVSGRGYGFFSWADLFTQRQLVALSTFSDLLIEMKHQIEKDAVGTGLQQTEETLRDGGSGMTAYAEALVTYLSFCIDRSADFWSSFAFWANQPKNEVVMHVFGRQAIAMIWDFAEVNPFSGSGGNWTNNLDYIIKAIEFLRPSQSAGRANQADASQISSAHSQLMISTDPPYYDNISYAELSDYFYVWLRKNLMAVYPEVFGTMLVPKTPELVAASHRFDGDQQKANKHFEAGLLSVFVRMRAFTDSRYPLSIYYAFKQSEGESDQSVSGKFVASTGWETMLTALVQAGFTIEGTWPIRTERSGGFRNFNQNALASSIVLVCRPRPENASTISRRQFVDALRRELPEALKQMQSGNIAPVDLAQASIGPGMAIYSRYSKVLEADGSALTVRAALGLINQELDAYLAEQDGSIDPDTRFAVAWFEQFSFNEGEFGHADVLARAKNTSVAGVEAAGLVVAGRGKVRLKHWTEYDPGAWDPKADRRPTVWEAVHHLIERLNAHGESGAAGLLLKMNAEMAAEARALAYRLYSICERKGWAEHALEYNKLVVSWTGVADQAAAERTAREQGDGTKQLGLFE